MVAVVTASALQRGRQLVERHGAIAILVELAEDVIGLRSVGSAGAERILELVLGDLAVTVGIDLREQIFQRILAARRLEGRSRLALRRQERTHGFRRNMRTAAGRKACAGALRIRCSVRLEGEQVWLVLTGTRRLRLLWRHQAKQAVDRG